MKCVCVKPKACDAFTQTRLMPAFRVSTSLYVEHRWPKAGDAQKGLLKVEKWEFRVQGFRVFRAQGTGHG